MKTLIKYLYLFIVPMILAGALLSSCDDDDAVENGGEPVVYYVRITSPESSDSLLTQAFLGNLVAIMGDNLADARQVYFNDKEAVLTPTFVTGTSILVRVPNEAPVDINNKIKIVFNNGTELLYDFIVSIPPPEILYMDLEYVPDGETAYINGLYFFDVTPVEVEFSDGAGGYYTSRSSKYNRDGGWKLSFLREQGLVLLRLQQTLEKSNLYSTSEMKEILPSTMMSPVRHPPELGEMESS